MPLVWTGAAPLLLASTSRPRRALLEAAGIPVDTERSGVDERAIERQLGPGTEAEILALRLARKKAVSVAAPHPGRIVLGADQVLACDGRLLGKPETPEEACRQLAFLTGRTHVLKSAVAIVPADGAHAEFVGTARLTMRALEPSTIAAYVAEAGPAATRSGGGYEIEGLGIHLFEAIDGEHSTILGLPLLLTLAAFRRLGLLAL